MNLVVFVSSFVITFAVVSGWRLLNKQHSNVDSVTAIKSPGLLSTVTLVTFCRRKRTSEGQPSARSFGDPTNAGTVLELSIWSRAPLRLARLF